MPPNLSTAIDQFSSQYFLGRVCTCDITNCILRIEDEGFNSDGSMTPNLSGTLETESFTFWVVFMWHPYCNPKLSLLLQRRECRWMLSALHLLFSQQFWRMWRLLNGKNKLIVSNFSEILHCSNWYSLHHSGSLRRCSLCQPVLVALLPGARCAKVVTVSAVNLSLQR